MTEKEIKISYKEFDSVEELPADQAELVSAARDAMKGSYSPYSGFSVGAALRLKSGRIVTAANQENAAFPSGLCAERSAMFYAASNYPEDAIVGIAVCGGPEGNMSESPVSPCGACRQVMAQDQRNGGEDMQVILAGTKKIWVFPRVEALLPFIFDDL